MGTVGASPQAGTRVHSKVKRGAGGTTLAGEDS